MSFTDWLRQTRREFADRPARDAARGSASELVTGAATRIGRRVNVGERVWDREWDVLVVLDASRPDLWRAVAPKYEWADPDPLVLLSCASSSQEWMGKQLPDELGEKMARTALLAANVLTPERTDPERWAHLDEVWQGWDDEAGQTPPRVVRDAGVGF